VQRSLKKTVGHVGICSSAEQRHHHVEMTEPGSPVKRSVATQIALVCTSAMRQQQFYSPAIALAY
jgi:hypothetical protein